MYERVATASWRLGARRAAGDSLSCFEEASTPIDNYPRGVTDGPWHVFIAYPRQERRSATALYDALAPSGARVFLDHIALSPGDVWAAKITAAQRGADVTAVLISKATERSFYENEEIAQAVALFRQDPERHRVVPVYLDAEADPPYGLRAIHSLWLAELGDMARLAAALLSLVGLAAGSANKPTPLPGHVPVHRSASRRSPFRPGMPLYASDFLPGASRRTLLAEMDADLRAGGNVNLVAERRMGRTSMLNHLYGRLMPDSRQVVTRINFQDDVATESDFYGAALWGLGQTPLGEDAIGSSRIRELQRTASAPYSELRSALRTLRRYATPIILLDEFERCFTSPEGFPFPTFFDSLRSLLGGDQHGPYAKAVVATRQPLAAYFTSRQLTSTLPSYLPLRQMGRLTEGDVDEALAQESRHPLERVHREHAAHLAQGHPCRVQSAGEAWYRALASAQPRQWVEAEYARLNEQTCLGAASST